MIIFLACLLPVSFALGAFIAVKCVQLGLRFQIQVAKKEEPKMESAVKPIADDVNNHKAAEASQYAKEMIQEYLFGADGKG